MNKIIDQNEWLNGLLDYARPPYFKGWTMFEKVWLLVFGGIIGGVTIYTGGSIASVVAALTGMVTVVLVAKRRISNYAWGVINVGIYGYLALQGQLFGEVMLNWLFYLPSQFVGYYVWKNNISSGLVETNPVSKKGKVFLGLLSIGGIIAYALFLQFLGGTLPLFDATSTVLSVIAQILMIKRMPEQWLLWAVVDIVSVYLWVTVFLATGTGLALAVMWLAYLVNTAYGYYMWSDRFEGVRG